MMAFCVKLDVILGNNRWFYSKQKYFLCFLRVCNIFSSYALLCVVCHF